MGLGLRSSILCSHVNGIQLWSARVGCCYLGDYVIMLIPFTLPLTQQSILTPILTQPHRHYHNIIHVNDCLAELYNWYAQNQSSGYIPYLTYAIWFHDIVYNPYAPHGVNEAQSAREFEKFENISSTGHHHPFVFAVQEAIKWTAYHITTNTFDYTNTLGGLNTLTIEDVSKFMLDIDLAQMGHSLAVFSKNSLNIRQEYHRTSDMDVVKGRLKFFKELDKRDTFYYTEFFRDLYHEQSKKNVKTEIDALEESIERDEPIYYFDHLLNYTADFA